MPKQQEYPHQAHPSRRFRWSCSCRRGHRCRSPPWALLLTEEQPGNPSELDSPPWGCRSGYYLQALTGGGGGEVRGKPPPSPTPTIMPGQSTQTDWVYWQSLAWVGVCMCVWRGEGGGFLAALNVNRVWPPHRHSAQARPTSTSGRATEPGRAASSPKQAGDAHGQEEMSDTAFLFIIEEIPLGEKCAANKQQKNVFISATIELDRTVLFDECWHRIHISDAYKFKCWCQGFFPS